MFYSDYLSIRHLTPSCLHTSIPSLSSYYPLSLISRQSFIFLAQTPVATTLKWQLQGLSYTTNNF